jgi:uncharacterized membrane protein YkoI
MKRHLFTIALALFTTGPLMAEDKHKDHHEKHDDSTEVEIKESELPAKVAQGFKKAHPDATIIKVEKETYEDKTVHYEITFSTPDGKKHEVELNTDGEVLPEHD